MYHLIPGFYKWVIYVIISVLFMHLSLGLDPHRFIPSRGKPVVMSSTEGDHEGSYATDGDYNNYDVTSGALKYSETTASDNPYLQIDLGSSIYVRDIHFLMPVHGGDGDNVVEISHGDDATVGSTANFVCLSRKITSRWTVTACKTIGRYVAIQKLGTNVKLYITELAVQNFPVEDVAFLKQITADSERKDYPVNRVTDYQDHTFGIVTNNEIPWLRVDLQYSYLVREVLIAARRDCCWLKRSHNIDLRIGNSLENNGNSNPPCASDQNIFAGESRMFSCNMFGRFINVFIRNTRTLSLAEIYINPETTSNIAVMAEAFANIAHSTSSKSVSRVIDMTRSAFQSVTNGANKLVWLDLGQTYNVAKVYIIDDSNQNKPLGINVSVGADNDHSTSTLCQPGIDRQEYDKSGPFFCEPRISGRYVFVQRDEYAEQLKISEIGVFEETAPLIIDMTTKSSQWQWLQQGSDITLTCEAKGYPVPVITWVKDNEVIESTSNTLQLTNVKCNQSGRYECWANNTHGVDAKEFYLSFHGKLLVCARYSEINFVVGQVETLYGHKWYKFFDPKNMDELEFKELPPGSRDTCLVWLNGKHPKVQDGVVSRQLCVKDETSDCSQTLDIHIRRCSTYYVYNFNTMTSLRFCYRSLQDIHGGFQPVMASPVKKHALSDKVFHTETNISKYYECLMMCQLEKKCKSFNYSKKLKTCQLNDGTKKEFPKKYGFNEDYDYYEMGRGVVMATKIDL